MMVLSALLGVLTMLGFISPVLLLLILFVIIAPNGIVGLVQSWRRKREA